METYQHRIEPKQVMSNTADSFLLYTSCTVLIVSYRNKSCPLGSFFIQTARTLVILFLQSHSTSYVVTVTAYSVINAKRQLIHCLDQLKFSIKRTAHV
jgi:hypothetical protein